MTIQEAAKSGKRFKRKQWAEFAREIGHPEIILQCDKTKEFLRISLNDLLATDWVIEEKKVEITYERLQIAHKNCLASSAYSIDALAKEIGLL